MFRTDLEIVQGCRMEHICGITVKIGVGEEDPEYYDNYKAEVSLDLLHRNGDKEDGKLILMAAINPTRAGEGKSTMAVGLGDALNRMGRKMMIALREPSLGSVFGPKDGATGGSYTQVIPMEDINLHFTGDMHAITTANNLISACLDNHIHQGNEPGIDIESTTWERCLDTSDCTLCHITIGQGPKASGVERVDGFSITVTSEVMAVLCLPASLTDLKERLGSMLVAFNSKKEPTYVGDLGIERALTTVMKDVIGPNVVRALEHNPVLTHDGPFANTAHGCSSILATGTCLKPADYTVTETDFGADLEAEEFLDIKCRLDGLKLNAVVIVVTIRALKQHGNTAYGDLEDENVEAMLTGYENPVKHINTVRQLGLPYIVTISELTSSTPAEVETPQNWCKEYQHPISLSQVWVEGGKGAPDLANQLVELCAEGNSYAPLCNVEQGIEEKITVTATRVHGTEEVALTEEAKEQIASYTFLGWDKMPICMAETQVLLSDDTKIHGASKNLAIMVRELHPSPGADFLVALTGKTLTMPGLPRMPAVSNMDINEKGHIEGLF